MKVFGRYQIIEYLGSAAFSRAVACSSFAKFTTALLWSLVVETVLKGAVFGPGHQQDGVHEDHQERQGRKYQCLEQSSREVLRAATEHADHWWKQQDHESSPSSDDPSFVHESFTTKNDRHVQSPNTEMGNEVSQDTIARRQGGISI
eukprot:Skav219408  [mRNA]  locus=scaffold1139:157082:157522:+ [translate_table: standard]